MASASAKGGFQKISGATNLVLREIHGEDPSFQLIRIEVDVDDRPVFNAADAAGLHTSAGFIPAPAVAAGPHAMKVIYILAGRGYGLFSYMSGYRFVVKSTRAFTVVPAETTCMSVILYFDQSTLTRVEQRPKLDLREERAPNGGPG